MFECRDRSFTCVVPASRAAPSPVLRCRYHCRRVTRQQQKHLLIPSAFKTVCSERISSGTMAPRAHRLDENGLRRVLGDYLDLPVVQAFINLMEPADNLKNVLDSDHDTHSDFGCLLKALEVRTESWDYKAQLRMIQRSSN